MAVATVENPSCVVAPPDLKQHGEADRERQKAAHRGRQLIERPRNFERDDQQRDGKREHGVAEAFEPRDFAAVVSGRGPACHAQPQEL
jgi:hypothetical protein